MNTYYLTEADISQIRAALVAMFEGDDAISPLGVRDQNLIASACSRPRTGLGDVEKYPTVAEKAAALLHALIANHPWWNGNGRTAFLAMAVFVEPNGGTFGDAGVDRRSVEVHRPEHGNRRRRQGRSTAIGRASRVRRSFDRASARFPARNALTSSPNRCTMPSMIRRVEIARSR
jgi:prophage maintenance system killer protein